MQAYTQNTSVGYQNTSFPQRFKLGKQKHTYIHASANNISFVRQGCNLMQNCLHGEKDLCRSHVFLHIHTSQTESRNTLTS